MLIDGENPLHASYRNYDSDMVACQVLKRQSLGNWQVFASLEQYSLPMTHWDDYQYEFR